MNYVIADHLVPAFLHDSGMSFGPARVGFDERLAYYREHGLRPPRNYRVLVADSGASLHVTFWNVDWGNFLIKARSRIVAYDLARAVFAYFSLFHGRPPDYERHCFMLTELVRVPQPRWTPEDFLHFISVATRDERNDASLINALRSGHGVFPEDIQHLILYVPQFLTNTHVREALAHLGLSRSLFFGYMVGSYYTSHHVLDRRDTTDSILQKRYFEHRERYELAFVAAFKGIERFLGVNQLKRAELSRLFERLGIAVLSPTRTYERRFEIFSGASPHIAIPDLVARFLIIRNATAAHSNATPPAEFFVSEDSLYEIQHFLEFLCIEALMHGPIPPLPAGALPGRPAQA